MILGWPWYPGWNPGEGSTKKDTSALMASQCSNKLDNTVFLQTNHLSAWLLWKLLCQCCKILLLQALYCWTTLWETPNWWSTVTALLTLKWRMLRSKTHAHLLWMSKCVDTEHWGTAGISWALCYFIMPFFCTKRHWPVLLQRDTIVAESYAIQYSRCTALMAAVVEKYLETSNKDLSALP